MAFDFDGLMFNTEDLYFEVADEMLRRRGRRCEPTLYRQIMGRPAEAAYQLMIVEHSLTDRPEDLAVEAGQIFHSLLEGRLAPMPGLVELLDRVESAGVPKAIASSSRLSYITGILERFEFRRRFPHILSAEDVTQGKPHPEIYLKTAERLGVEPGELLVLEDSQNGCRAAIAAGAFAVGVPNGHSRDHCFDGARLVIDSLADPRLYEALGLK